jgi:osmotically-inducible protein OsmY
MLSVLMAVCLPLCGQNQTSDDLLYDKVRLRLASDPVVKGGGLEVSVKDAVVTLRGKVQTDKQKTRAEHLARKVKGVKKVVNELLVDRP